MTFDVNDFTVLVGKNGAGKSTVIDALEIALGDAKMSAEDVPVGSGGPPVPAVFRAYFEDLPQSVVVDAAATTSLSDERLVMPSGELCVETVCEVATTGGKLLTKPKAPERSIVCDHFVNDPLAGLLSKRNKDLKALVQASGIGTGVDLTNNVSMRVALRNHHSASGEQMGEARIPIDGGDAKPIWDALEELRPRVVAFRADRESTDQDAEAQDPIKDIVSVVLEGQRDVLNKLETAVSKAIDPLLVEAIDFFSDVEPDLAKKLRPTLAPPAWPKAFRFALHDDSEIAVNRWSSGARRLLLMSLFRAQSVRDVSDERPTLHLVEEPETALHPRLQRRLVRTLIDLGDTPGHQVVVTTHSPGLVHDVHADAIRVVRTADDIVALEETDTEGWREVARDLGVTPDGRVRAFLCVEGPGDETGLIALSKSMHRWGILDWDLGAWVSIRSGEDRMMVGWRTKTAA